MNTHTSVACSRCGNGSTKIVSTTAARTQSDMRRKRLCLRCSEGFVTYEISAQDYSMLQSMRKFMETMRGREQSAHGDTSVVPEGVLEEKRGRLHNGVRSGR